jgi:K+-transporting ATPase KdpF subunit
MTLLYIVTGAIALLLMLYLGVALLWPEIF